MKKLLAVLMVSVSIMQFGLVQASEVEAETATDVKVQMNGKLVNFDVAPIIKYGSTLVPCRAIAEAFGATVEFSTKEEEASKIKNRFDFRYRLKENKEDKEEVSEAEKKMVTRSIVTITKDKKKIEIVIGDYNANMVVDEEKSEMYLYQPAIIEDGRTFVPLRFIGEAFDCMVGWDENQKTAVIIDTKPLWDKLKDNAPKLYTYLDTKVIRDSIKVLEDSNVSAKFTADASQNAIEVKGGIKITGESNFVDGDMQAKYNAEFMFENSKASLVNTDFDSLLKANMNYNVQVIFKDGEMFVRTSSLGIYDLFDNSSMSNKWIKMNQKDTPIKLDKTYRENYDEMLKNSYRVNVNANTYSQLEAGIVYIGMLEKTVVSETMVEGKKKTTIRINLDEIKKLIPDETVYKQFGWDEFFNLKPTIDFTVDILEDGKGGSNITTNGKFGINIKGGEMQTFTNGRLQIDLKGESKMSPLSSKVEITAPNKNNVFDPYSFRNRGLDDKPYVENDNVKEDTTIDEGEGTDG